MNKAELVSAIADQADLSKAQAQNALDATLETITEALSKKQEVRLIGFGTFSSRHTAARTGHNPASGEKIEIAAKYSPSFKAGSTLKTACNS